MRASYLFIATFLVGVSSSSLALAADEVPKTTLSGDTASKGNSEVTATGFQTAAKADERKAKDATELTVTFGGMYVSGNAQLLALTAGAAFRLRRESNQLSVAAAVNYSEGSTDPANKPTAPTVDNQQGKIRYDRFFGDSWAAFLGVQARRDRFIGVDLRLQVDPGVSYYFINEGPTQLWFELGYDMLYDVRRDDALNQYDASGNVTSRLDKTQLVHSARAFLGYKHKINGTLQLAGALEYLQGLSDTDIRRLSGDFSVTSKLTKALSLASAFSFRHDSRPLPGKQNLDTTTSLNLVVTLL